MNDRRTRLAGTFQRFAEEAQNRAAVIRGIVLTGFPQGQTSIQTVMLHAHALAGTGETMSADRMGAIGAEIEDLLRALPPGSGPAPDLQERLDALSAELSGAARDFDPNAALDLFMQRIFPAG